MSISLPERTVTSIDALTPREIVAELDKYVVGQAKAKRAVAIALRNRLRRQKLTPELADDVAPKNILMIGPTGVGKTEIARRLARLAQSPFIKVEASKFTEVGYVGRDVESMVRDLVELAVNMVREEQIEKVAAKAELNTEERLLDLLLPPRPAAPDEDPGRIRDDMADTRQRMREQLREGRLDERMVEVDVQEKSFPSVELITGSSMEEIGVNLRDMMPGLFQGRFPIRVELEPLGRAEFVRILTEPRSALIKQYIALMATEGLDLSFTDDAVATIAEYATLVNERTENIGARRLHTVMERLLDEVSFEAPNMDEKSITIDAPYVRRMLADIVKNEDLSRFIL